MSPARLGVTQPSKLPKESLVWIQLKEVSLRTFRRACGDGLRRAAEVQIWTGWRDGCRELDAGWSTHAHTLKWGEEGKYHAA